MRCSRCGHDEVSHLIAWPRVGLCMISDCSCGASTVANAVLLSVVGLGVLYLAARIASWAYHGCPVVR